LALVDENFRAATPPFQDEKNLGHAAEGKIGSRLIPCLGCAIAPQKSCSSFLMPHSFPSPSPRPVALAFFPHAFWPPATGAHHRFLEIVRGLLDLGYATHAVTYNSGYFRWTAEQARDVQETLGPHFGLRVLPPWTWRDKLLYLWRTNLSWKRKAWLLGGIWKGSQREWRQPPEAKPGLQDAVDALVPDLLYYAYSGHEQVYRLAYPKPCFSILDVHDFVRLNKRLQSRIQEAFSDAVPDADAPVLREDFSAAATFHPDEEEWRQLEPFDAYLAISEEEGKAVESRFSEKKTVHLPVTQSVAASKSNYDGLPLMAMGPNAFNLQGLYYFIQRILPSVLEQIPEFRIQLTGLLPPEPDAALGAPYVQRLGFLTDLAPVYRASSFFVCPTYAGTGQQIKIVQAMANGLSVIALRWAAKRSPLAHEVNGLIVDTADDFADAVVRLWRDRDLAARLGQAARKTVADRFSPVRCREALQSLCPKTGPCPYPPSP
jgi:hypothetical protein